MRNSLEQFYNFHTYLKTKLNPEMRLLLPILLSLSGLLQAQSSYLSLAYSPSYTNQQGSFEELTGNGFRAAVHIHNDSSRMGGGLEFDVRNIPYLQRVRYPYHWEEQVKAGKTYSAGAFLSYALTNWHNPHNFFVSAGAGLWLSEVYYKRTGAFFFVLPENTQYEASHYLRVELGYSYSVKPWIRLLVNPGLKYVGGFERNERTSIARKYILFSSLDLGLMIAL